MTDFVRFAHCAGAGRAGAAKLPSAFSVVASDGLEPSRSNRAADFKSAVSTNSTTRPR